MYKTNHQWQEHKSCIQKVQILLEKTSKSLLHFKKGYVMYVCMQRNIYEQVHYLHEISNFQVIVTAFAHSQIPCQPQERFLIVQRHHWSKNDI